MREKDGSDDNDLSLYPFKATSFNKDTSLNTLKKISFEVLGPYGEGTGGIDEEGEGDQRKQGRVGNKNNKEYIFGFLGILSCCSVSH